MAIRNLRYGNDEILRKRAREVEIIDEKIKELAQDMMDTMHKYDGVGLAAPQVGILKRVIVIDLYEENTQYILVNPIIKKDLLAQALSHEIDHLNGEVFINKVEPGTLETVSNQELEERKKG